MAISYRLIPYLDGEPVSVQLLEDSVSKLCIPFDPDNTDYREYLEWVAEGNTPDPADS